ncbi:hypothetical protein HN587_03580 [Candidatus Woesearchaeota archaeon]|nr:hypothetical protein [Candidatus Woesearchaeota archaeon]
MDVNLETQLSLFEIMKQTSDNLRTQLAQRKVALPKKVAQELLVDLQTMRSYVREIESGEDAVNLSINYSGNTYSFKLRQESIPGFEDIVVDRIDELSQLVTFFDMGEQAISEKLDLKLLDYTLSNLGATYVGSAFVLMPEGSTEFYKVLKIEMTESGFEGTMYSDSYSAASVEQLVHQFKGEVFEVENALQYPLKETVVPILVAKYTQLFESTLPRDGMGKVIMH